MAINNDMIEPSTNPNPGAEQNGEEGHRAEPSVEERPAEGLAQEEVNANTTVNEPVSEEPPAEQAE